MFRTFRIIWSSFKVALQEFRSNKLRTSLSLLGIIIGIFCIISVLSTISSMQQQVNNDLKSLGNKTIYIDKAASLKRFTARAKGRGNRIEDGLYLRSGRRER